MQSGRNFNKRTAGRGQAGFTKSATAPRPLIYPSHVQVASAGNPLFKGEQESKKVFTGPGDGEFVSSGTPQGKMHGYFTHHGDAFKIDGESGHIVMQHRSGSAVTIDPDGSVFVSSESARGVGISAPFGDAWIGSGGHIVINGAALSISARGDLTLDVGGTLTISAKNIVMQSKAMDVHVDGSMSTSIVDDNSTVIGGINRTTVAGDQRLQIAGESQNDIGKNNTTRVGGDDKTFGQGKGVHAYVGDVSEHSGGKYLIDGDTEIDLVAPDVQITSNLYVTDFIGTNGKIKANDEISSDVPMKAPAYDPGTSGLGQIEQQQGYTDSIDKPKAPDANTVIDEMTSERKYPQYPGNGKIESSSMGSTTANQYDASSQAKPVYDNYSSKNRGNLNPVSAGSSLGDISSMTSSGTSVLGNDVGIGPSDMPTGTSSGVTSATGTNIAVESPYPLPSSKYDSGARISRYFTLGDIIHAPMSHEIPASMFADVVKQHARVAYNVLDVIKQQFPDIVITSGWRENSPNHITGRAIDLVCQSMDMARHADIALFAIKNTPCDQVFLEKNDTSRTHVHLRVTAQDGVSSTPSVLTCADALCHSRTQGIDLQYLTRRGIS